MYGFDDFFKRNVVCLKVIYGFDGIYVFYVI